MICWVCSLIYCERKTLLDGRKSTASLMEFLELWDIISNVELHGGIQDKHIWRLSASGEYRTKSAYEAFFQGAIYLRPYERIWKSWLLPNAVFSCRWFLITGAGQLTGLLGKDFPTRPNVCFVTRNRKPFSTFSLGAFLLGSSGFLSCSASDSHSRLSPMIQLGRTGEKRWTQLPLGM